MQLVVEGTERFRRIISVGVDGHVYDLGPDQAIRNIDNADWPGWRKSEIEWDETGQKIIPKRREIFDAEMEEERILTINAEISAKIPDMLRQQLSWDEMIVEAKTIDEASRVKS